MAKYQKYLALTLRRVLMDTMEGSAKGIRKRKLSNSGKDVVVVDAHVAKQRKTIPRKDKSVLESKSKDKKTRKSEAESVGLDSKSILPLEQSSQSSCLLFMKKDQVLAIQGKAWIKILQGAVDIMGFKMNTGQQTHLFSPNCSSLLTIKECNRTENNQLIQSAIKDFRGFQNEQVKKKAVARAQKVSSVLLLTKMDSIETAFVCQFKEYEDLFSTNTLKDGEKEDLLNKVEKKIYEITSPLGFMLVDINSERYSVYKEPEEWANIMSNVRESLNTSSRDHGTRNPCILVCGGKGVGKSSLARYIMNDLLNSCNEVCYLECDVGQTEFTPPAILSLNHVTTPILGPPFTHLRWPERAHFFGDVSPKDNPNLYISSITSLYKHYQENYLKQRNIPLVVNTQGWVKGMGIPLLIDVIRITQPSHIVQINSPTQTKNLPTITMEFLDTSPGWVYPIPIEEQDQTKKLMLGNLVDNLRDGKDDNSSNAAHLLRRDTQSSQPTIIHLESCTVEEQGTGPKLKASDYRAMDVLAYFSQLQDPGTNNNRSKPNVSLLECRPYKVPWHHVAVHVIHTEVPRSQILVSLNASVVGLAVSPKTDIFEANNDRNDLPKFLKETPIVDCIGLGIIRNIDPANKLFYILTPVPLNKLHRVNTLLKGNLEIPATLLIKEGRPGAPYVSTEFSYDIKGAGARKVRYNLQRKQLNSPARPKT